MEQIRTYKFRLKDGGSKRKHLVRWAESVNLVWNYCNEASFQQLRKHSKWLFANDLMKLTSGAGKELGLNSQVVQQVCKEYWTRRFNAKRRKLSWRKSKGTRRSLGWIPCTNQNVKIAGDRIKFGGKTFRFWKTREIPTDVRSISFNEDARGRWYINIVSLVDLAANPGTSDLGIDLGLKTVATLSDGRKFDRDNMTAQYAERLAMAQRAGKTRLVKRIHAKIANIRKDWNHKTANAILAGARLVCVGDVSSAKLVKTRMAKSVLDASWSQLKSMLAYKALGLGIDLKEVNESWTTRLCSHCGALTGPGGQSGLSVREWVCDSCGTHHDRDVNSAVNILRRGHSTPIKGIPRL